MKTIDLVIARIRWVKGLVTEDDIGQNIIYDWTFAFGILSPSIKYFPTVWNIFFWEKPKGGSIGFTFHREKLTKEYK